MGLSTDGYISYGIMFPEEFEFPWGTDEWEWDIDDWWAAQSGFRKYDKSENYFTERTAWFLKHPTPVTEVNYCSCDVPMIILAVPKSVYKCSRGYPTAFSPVSLGLNVGKVESEALIQFCDDYNIDTDGEEPQWYLSSSMC